MTCGCHLTPWRSCKHTIIIATEPHPKSACLLQRSSGGRTQKIPMVALEIKKDRYLTIGFHAARRNEPNAGGPCPCIRCVEVIDAEKEPDAFRELLADDLFLADAVRAREQDPRSGTRWSHHYPAFGATVVRERWDVFDQLELQDIDEEVDGRAVLPHHERNQLKMGHRCRYQVRSAVMERRRVWR